jgi:hypothetical protein
MKESKAREIGSRAMKNTGCDLHTRHQQVAMLDQKTDTHDAAHPT